MSKSTLIRTAVSLATVASILGTSVLVASAATCSFTRSLTVGSRGEDVRCLQQHLNSDPATRVASSGAGSPGSETTYFGSLTKAAVVKWQNKYAASVLAPLGLSAGTGFWGSSSRSYYSALAGGAPAPAPAPVPAGTGLTVTLASDQPVSSLAPGDAARIPFTKVFLTASSDGDVSVSSLVVERTGLAADAALAGVLLLDEQGNQLGLVKTLNSDHQATVGESFVVKAGQTRTVIVAANRAAVGGAFGGQTLALRVVKVNTTATVRGTLPVTGTTHTVNETLTIGSVTMAKGPIDPGSSQTKEIGTTSYTFSSVKVTAGSAEKVYLKSMRWNQTGSAGSGDLKNVKSYVDGVAYDTNVSSDGKYYSTVFPSNGILIDKGFNKEVSVRGDIAGGSNRTVDFDVAKRTDLFVVGETYGYGIIPPQTGSSVPTADTSAFSSSEDPWYDASQVTVSQGTMTVSSWTAVAAQNIAVNLADQPLGGWSVDVKGESISVGKMVFNLFLTESTGSAFAVEDMDNLKLVQDGGATLSGPVDPSGTGKSGTVTFTDTVTFPVGVTNFRLVGKLSTDSDTNDTAAASTTPDGNWTTVTGQLTGVSITPKPSSAVSGQTMTVKGAAVTISVSAVPIAQTIIAGTNQFEFARYIMDTTGSGEDLRLTSLPLEYNVPSGSANDLTNCKLYDGSTVLTTGGNVVNPSAAGSSTVFTFDGTGLTLTKGLSKQLSLKCDLKAAATGGYLWGYDSSSSPSPTGLVSGQTATVTENDSPGQRMTAAAAGTLAVTLDSGSPSYAVVAPGQSVELVRIKFSASNENVDLKQVALQLTGGASNTPDDLVNQTVTLHDTLGTKVGEAVFASGDFATSSAITGFQIPKDGSKVLVVKGTVAGVSASGPLTRSGDLYTVDYDGGNVGLNGNYGTGVSSGSTINGGSTDTASNGVRVMKAYPTFEYIALSSTERTLVAGDGKNLYKFKVTANNGDVALYKVTFSVSSSTAAASNATTSKFSLYAFTDSAMSVADPNFSGTNNPGGLVNAGNCYSGKGSSSASAGSGSAFGANGSLVEIHPDKTSCNGGTTSLVIPSGSSRWFRLSASIGTLAPSGTSENIQVQLEGDSAYMVNSSNLMQQAGAGPAGTTQTAGGNAGTVDADTNDDFIWSPRSTSTSESIADLDWTNGYGVIGLPSTNMTTETLSK